MKKSFFLNWLLPTALSGLLLFSLLSIGSFGVAVAADDPDDESPSYVDNVVATPGDGEITLTWDAATDNVGVTGYMVYMGTESVEEAGDDYNLGSEEVGDVLEYTVEGLENDTTYYFAMTALDAAGNESEVYSYEASATPTASVVDDGDPPTVVSAEPTDCTTVEVTFDEAVTYPDESPEEAFTIENLDNFLYLDVTDVTTSADDDATLVLTTEEMEEGAQYLLTAGIAIEDMFENAIVSGTSDSASFTGVACAAEEDTEGEEDTEETDVDAPELSGVEVLDLTTLELTFNEDVYPGEGMGPDEDIAPVLELFSIADEDSNEVAVLDLEYGETDGEEDMSKLVLTTEEHMADTTYYISIDSILDASDNEATGIIDQYTTPADTEEDTEEEDTVAPEDVTDFMVDVVDSLMNLSWTSSVDSAGDLVDQYLYVSTDGGSTYGDAESLGDSEADYSYDGAVEGNTYAFKLTTVDDSGNESDGVVVTAALPATGPGLALLAAVSLMGGGALGRRRKK